MWLVIAVLWKAEAGKSILEFEVNLLPYLKVTGPPVRRLCLRKTKQKYTYICACMQCILLNLIILIKKYMLIRTYLVKFCLDLLIIIKSIDFDTM